MGRLTRDGTAEPVSRNQILRRIRGQGIIHFPYSADYEQDWQPYPIDLHSAICYNHTYIYVHTPAIITFSLSLSQIIEYCCGSSVLLIPTVYY